MSCHIISYIISHRIVSCHVLSYPIRLKSASYIQNLNLNVCLASIWFRCSEFLLDIHNTDLHWYSGHELGDARVGVRVGVRGACMHCSCNGRWKGQQLQAGSLHTKATLNSQHAVTFFPRNVNKKNKSMSGTKLVAKLWTCKAISVERQHYVSRQTERETVENTLEQDYVELRGGKCQEVGESSIACHLRQAPRRLKQGKISRVCSTNGRKEKINEPFWWQIWTTLKSQE